MLGLKDVTAVHGRAEDYAKQKEHREKYDFCVSRAVANLSTLSEYCIPFVKEGGSFISYKSGKIDEELSQAEKCRKNPRRQSPECSEISPCGHGYGSFFRCDQEDETDR